MWWVLQWKPGFRGDKCAVAKVYGKGRYNNQDCQVVRPCGEQRAFGNTGGSLLAHGAPLPGPRRHRATATAAAAPPHTSQPFAAASCGVVEKSNLLAGSER